MWGASPWADLPWSDGPASASATAYTLTADAGAYLVTGQAATLKRNRVLSAAAGSYAITGKAATIAYSGASVIPSLIRFNLSTGRLVKIINASICIDL